MKMKLVLGSLITLVIIFIINITAYSKLKSKMTIEKVTFENMKDDSDKSYIAVNNEPNLSEIYGYSDILELIKKEPKIKITKFDKSEIAKEKLIVLIESNNKDIDMDKVVNTITEMDNFLTIKSLSIKGENITINTEFKMTYK
jgi:hypothetical protein